MIKNLECDYIFKIRNSNIMMLILTPSSDKAIRVKLDIRRRQLLFTRTPHGIL